ncbi:oligosaccharyl transferase alpha subunit [Cantharellus anzutake]|uniref:oligosaccharyl transferase alpha subunit n=1 Tax=Cantharellus anzutake TaxID=1750568 RepID=UPI0019079227|nr:oligosaccharyl transferase alpha subunit [Cantharellus anzutake]KAF8339080.1 oligosaccharyl transferase alpha subunit [Cantharellus anzutake]
MSYGLGTFMLSSLLPFFLHTVSALNVPPSFENVAVVRTIELGGSSVHVTTSISARSLANNNAKYFFVLSKEQDDLTKWIEARPFVYYSVNIPDTLGVNETITLLVNTIEAHATTPLPATAKQTGAYVLSPYASLSQRTKLRSPSPTIHSYSEPSSLSSYASNVPVTKSGAVVTYGPFQNIPPSADKAFFNNVQEIVKIHYVYDQPILTVSSLRRTAEISHWGDNLNIQDDIKLLNDGARLEGQFSRIDYQRQNFFQKGGSSILPGFTIQLPAGARDPYFTDIVGNVSTSRFRPAPPKSNGKGASDRNSILEVKPRYPLIGGWNYTFRLGWDAPLGESTLYIAAIPFFTHIPGSVVDDAEVKIILPEGATDSNVYVPFAVDELYRGTHGRPSIILKKRGLTVKHTGLIYVSYSLSLTAHLNKVAAVASASFILFAIGLVLRRTDTTIHRSI